MSQSEMIRRTMSLPSCSGNRRRLFIYFCRRLSKVRYYRGGIRTTHTLLRDVTDCNLEARPVVSLHKKYYPLLTTEGHLYNFVTFQCAVSVV